MKIRILLSVIAILSTFVGPVFGAQEKVYGLESVKITQVLDPDALPNLMLLVSGSLKLVGSGPGGNVWQTVTYIPQRPAAPRNDHGIYKVVGSQIVFFSLLTFSQFVGTLLDDGEKISIERVNALGQSQAEVWYFVR